jgi:hypothetical protein
MSCSDSIAMVDSGHGLPVSFPPTDLGTAAGENRGDAREPYIAPDCLRRCV